MNVSTSLPSSRRAHVDPYLYLALSSVLLALTTFTPARKESDALVLVGKSYPQYEQVSEAFAQEWVQLTGRKPLTKTFPNDYIAQSQLLQGHIEALVCLGEAPMHWAIQQAGDFDMTFTMIVDLERLKRLHQQSGSFQRRLRGVSIDVPVDDKLAIAVQLVPKLKRIGVITQDPELRESVNRLHQSCQKLNLELIHLELAATSELPEKLEGLLKQIDLLWSLPDGNVWQAQLAQFIIGRCTARRVPLCGLSATFVKAGATFSFERDYREIGRLLANVTYRSRNGEESQQDWLIAEPQAIVVSINQRSFESLGLLPSVPGDRVQLVKY